MNKKKMVTIAGVMAYCIVALTFAVMLSSIYPDKFNSFDSGLFIPVGKN